MKKKLLWILPLCLVLVAAMVVGAVMLLGDSTPKLYRNLDGHNYAVNTQMREKDENGLYWIRFACDGAVVELATADEATMLYIDSMDTMGLTFDKNRLITQVTPAESFVTEVFDDYFVKVIQGDTIHVNSSLAMNGAVSSATLNKKTKLYDICDGNVTAATASELKPLDAISAYADEKGNILCIYIISHPVESDVYWRTSRKYSSSTKETTREPDENGVYSIDFYARGETVTLQCKDKSLVTTIDLASSDSPHFGFVFDADGYIIDTRKSAFGIRGLLACEEHDVTAMEGDYVETFNFLSGKGEIWNGNVAENCCIIDISAAAYAEGRKGQVVDSLQKGDRVTVFTDTENRAVLVYVTNRIVDVPAYFSTSRKYSSSTKETTRKPDADGFYSVSLVKEGDTQAVTYKTQDKALMTYLDSTASRCVGIVADENNILQRVYMPECIFGQSAWSSGGVVASVTGSVVTRMTYGKPTSLANNVMMPECKVYNMSTTGQYGAETKLQQGDYMYAFSQPTGELVKIFVVRRCNGPETMYYNISPQYDSETKETTRKANYDGWYHFTLYHDGQVLQLRTGDKALADKLDSYTAVSLKVNTDIIEEVNAPNYACGGSEVVKGQRYNGLNSKKKHVAVDEEGTETAFTMDSSTVIIDTTREGILAESLTEGDRITVYTNRDGIARIIFIHA
ncbi:MAG: hypothetical protein IKU07_01620 [Oscillospiraceae bacterium]|nr:hypothetical protein [Oscillospiraceae bacterium]